MLNDLRHAFRLLGSNPGFTIFAILALGIGIGLATAIFTAYNSFSLHPPPVPEEGADDIGMLLRVTLAAVILVLLIACANVANLLLAKGATRKHEMAIRASLGASRGRIVRQVLTESLVLGVLGGVAGLFVGVWANSLMITALPKVVSQGATFDFDWRVFLFTAGSAVASALIFGLIPALHISRQNAAELKEGGRGGTGSVRAHRIRNALVVAQVAIAFVLLVGAGLLVRSFVKLQRAEHGIDAKNVLTFRVEVPSGASPAPGSVSRVFDPLTKKLEQIPGVQNVGLTSLLPGAGTRLRSFRVEAPAKSPQPAGTPRAVSRSVSPGYFATLRIPVVEGRLFDEGDGRDKPRVVVVEQAFAEEWFPRQNVIGKRIQFDTTGREPEWATIVGVAGTVPQKLLGDAPKHGFYTPASQDTESGYTFVLKVNDSPVVFEDAVQKAVNSVIPRAPIQDLQTMEHALERAYWDRKFFSQLGVALGAGALFLASLGIYGVMTTAVAQRTQEIGVRMALGAQPRDVLSMINQQGLRLVGLGLAIGLTAAVAFMRFIGVFLYGVSPNDPATYFLLSLVLIAVACIACRLPARRATRIAPMSALRDE